MFEISLKDSSFKIKWYSKQNQCLNVLFSTLDIGKIFKFYQEVFFFVRTAYTIVLIIFNSSSFELHVLKEILCH